jgi:hypothetical protein
MGRATIKARSVLTRACCLNQRLDRSQLFEFTSDDPGAAVSQVSGIGTNVGHGDVELELGCTSLSDPGLVSGGSA